MRLLRWILLLTLFSVLPVVAPAQTGGMSGTAEPEAEPVVDHPAAAMGLVPDEQ